MPDSLTTQFEALHAERQRTWPAAQLQKNIDQRAALSARYDAAAHIQTGQRLPEFTLKSVDGGTITRNDIGPNGAVFVFFRFAGCPACNLALPYYQTTLWPDLKAQGIQLIAVSPHVPEGLIDIKTRHRLDFTVASDTDNAFGKALGITFEPDDISAVPPSGWIGEVIGTHSWTLPQPTVLIVDKDARVRFVEVSPDWLKRTESDVILNALTEAKVTA
ncbi:peroxiredoxin-like family protein [Asticcacaulis sp. BYS171W]|uniref:thioredoxin-dependent peroxiredoxin n=1 Tax=Asticcacaulis aquaticus TaxID=2984212 RepID=A0ABT5HUL3_9CAUL|nr:peroxiredoxin-like family protein [Asticcacaulis aquaticus]MDC7683756.1 peroxiredoxin-like family protein [Asticcacaulis aquaticus]